MQSQYRWVIALIGLTVSFGSAQGAFAQPASAPDGWQTAVKDVILPDIARVLGAPIVPYTIKSQNARLGEMASTDINALDTEWRTETSATAQPMISAVLSNPTSSYLTRVQAMSIGLYSEIFVMDRNGLNVGQSNISSDYWQGDEAKFTETYPNGPKAVFIDEPEFRDDIGVWVVQVNVSVADGATPIGAATFEVNLTELDRRQSAGL